MYLWRSKITLDSLKKFSMYLIRNRPCMPLLHCHLPVASLYDVLKYLQHILNRHIVMIHVLLIVFILGSSPDLVMVKRYIQVLQILLVQLPRPGKYFCSLCRYVIIKSI